MDLFALLAPWFQALHQQVPGLELFDAHTHIGEHDPDGMRQSPAELIAGLQLAGARGCFVFPMHEPDGYPPANDMVLAAAREAPNGLFVPFCRVNPFDGAVAEAERSLANGAKGIKLHPRAEQFELDHPVVRDLFALANERSLPILIHAGRGIVPPGVHLVKLAAEYPSARVILAHAGVTDLSWMWRAVVDLPNITFDSSWWMPADLLTLFSLVPPAQILFASDIPYGHTAIAAITQLRLMQQAGLSADQIRLICAGQSLRIAAAEPLETAGPAVGERQTAPHLLLDRVSHMIQLGLMLNFRGADGSEILALADLACVVPDGHDDAPLFAVIRSLITAYNEARTAAPADRRVMSLLMLASTIASTPDVPLPAV